MKSNYGVDYRGMGGETEALKTMLLCAPDFVLAKASAEIRSAVVEQRKQGGIPVSFRSSSELRSAVVSRRSARPQPAETSLSEQERIAAHRRVQQALLSSLN